MAHDVFISCSAADKPVGDAICATLEANAIRCWIAPRDCVAGPDEDAAIFAAIAASKMIIVVLSSRADASEPFKPEIDRAVIAGIPIIPVRTPSVTTLSGLMSAPFAHDALAAKPGVQIAKVLKIASVLIDQAVGVPPQVTPRAPLRLVPATPKSPRRGIFVLEHRKIGRPVMIVAAICLIGGLLFAWQLAMDARSNQAQRRAANSFAPTAMDRTASDGSAGAIAPPRAVGAAHACLKDYPVESVRHGEQGTTILGFTITENGTTDNIHVVSSSGSERLDATSAQCIASWRYKPATKYGDPIAVPWKAKVMWTLH